MADVVIAHDGGSPGAIKSPPAREISPSQLASMPTPRGGGRGAQPGPSVDSPKPPPSTPDHNAPKPAKQDLHDGLRKLAGMEADPPKPGTETSPDGTKRDGDGTKPPGSETPGAATAPKKDKPNPWKLYESEKIERAKLEQQLQDTRKGQLAENDRKSFEDRVTKAEARAKELEDHIRFVDYQKSEEFQTQYAKPLEGEWKRVLEDLGDIVIQDPAAQGGSRPLSAQDIYELVHLPRDKAKELAKEIFGDDADDVMAARKSIKTLLSKQQEALDSAKKNGEERTRQQAEQTKAQQAALVKEVSTRFNEFITEVTSDKVNGEFFTARKPAEEGVELTPEEREHNEAFGGCMETHQPMEESSRVRHQH